MKKFTALISLALCLIIGGVYAAWVYPGTTVNQATAQFTPSLTIDNNSGAPGTITAASDLAISIENEGEYKAYLLYTGELAITYAPALGASAEYAQGIPMQIVIDISKVPGSFSNTMGGTADQTATIFSTVVDEHETPATATVTQLTIYSPEVGAGTVDTFDTSVKTLGTYVYNSHNNTYTWTITAAQFEQLVVFCDGASNVYLSNRAIADDFSARAGRSLIDLTINKKAS